MALLTTSDQYLGTASWYAVSDTGVYYSFDVYGKYLSRNEDLLQTYVELYAVGYTNGRSFYWNDTSSYAVFRIYNNNNTSVEYSQARGPFKLGTVNTTAKWIASIDVIVQHDSNGLFNNRRWNFDHLYFPDETATDKMSQYGQGQGYNYYIDLPPIDVATIKVYMGGEYKKGSPYIYQNGAWKKGKAYLFDNSYWKKGK